MDLCNWLGPKGTIAALSMKTREMLCENGIALTPEEEQRISDQHTVVVRDAGRIEFGNGAIELIVGTFSHSRALHATCAVDVLCDAIERFYSLRARVSVEVGDAEIAEALLQAFEDCEGAFELVDTEKLSESLEPREAEYSIADEYGRTYCWGPEEWEYLEHVDGWDGEQWGGNLDV